nr:hypothetical protein [Tanacetum cinerariifolium]
MVYSLGLANLLPKVKTIGRVFGSVSAAAFFIRVWVYGPQICSFKECLARLLQHFSKAVYSCLFPSLCSSIRPF